MLQNTNIYKNCVCYQKEEKPSIFLKELPEGGTGQSYLTSHFIIFVLDGIAKYLIPDSPDKAIEVHSGEFIFFPVSTNMIWEAAKNTTVLLFRLSHIVSRLPECCTFRLQRQPGGSQPESPSIEQKGVYPLKMNERVRHFIEGVVAFKRDGLKCSNYARNLIAQLLSMIQIYYTQEEYMRFYSYVMTPDVVFSDLIYDKWREHKTVNELADLFNMTLPQFSQRFVNVFGESPGAWLQRHRKEYIYLDICSSRKSMKQIAMENDFSMPNFIRYCRMNYGGTPCALRESLTARIKLPEQEQTHVG